jgi:wyosine [tRNA(Phe)-imidazoG37] synthetase (radical SAM superfamily)
MNVLKLQDSIIYGPVASRRLGRSLGINLMPITYKLCSFNCVYCHYGVTDKLILDTATYAKDLPDFDNVLEAVSQALRSSIGFDYLTFSGNGEPTLYPQFRELVQAIQELRKKYRPKVKIALLSNSTGLIHESVRQSIHDIDMPVLKLDTGNEDKFKAVNRPAHDVVFSDIVDLLASLENIYIQTIFLDGDPSNINKADIEEYYEKIALINPRAVHIYSIDRPVSYTGIKRVLPDKLEHIARFGKKRTGVLIEPFYVK